MKCNNGVESTAAKLKNEKNEKGKNAAIKTAFREVFMCLKLSKRRRFFVLPLSPSHSSLSIFIIIVIIIFSLFADAVCMRVPRNSFAETIYFTIHIRSIFSLNIIIILLFFVFSSFHFLVFGHFCEFGEFFSPAFPLRASDIDIAWSCGRFFPACAMRAIFISIEMTSSNDGCHCNTRS